MNQEMIDHGAEGMMYQGVDQQVANIGGFAGIHVDSNGLMHGME